MPNVITNGQVADATKVMDDLNTLANCGSPGGAVNAIEYNADGQKHAGVGPLTNGQLVIGSTGAPPQAAALTAGPGIAIANGPGSITISAPGGSGVSTGATVRRSTPQSILPNATTAIIFDLVTKDNGGYWNAANPSRLTAPSAGWYIVTGGVHWAGFSGLGRRIAIAVNNTPPFVAMRLPPDLPPAGSLDLM
jgi:hypothetical protein